MGGVSDSIFQKWLQRLLARSDRLAPSLKRTSRWRRLSPGVALRWGLGSILDFLAEDACSLCGRSHHRRAGEEAIDLPARHLIEPVEIRSLFGVMAVVNHPVCARCAGQFVVARRAGVVGEIIDSSVVVTASGEKFVWGLAGESGRASAASARTRFVTVLSPFMTTDATLKIVHLFKFGGYADLSRPIARTMAWAVREYQTGGESRWILVPTPMDERSKRRRGFNQAETLARLIADDLGAGIEPGCLCKTARTRRQSKTKPECRAQNVRDAFSSPVCAQATLRGRPVLLVDDLVTTGATAAACAATLLGRGAESVTVVSFGRAI